MNDRRDLIKIQLPYEEISRFSENNEGMTSFWGLDSEVIKSVSPSASVEMMVSKSPLQGEETPILDCTWRFNPHFRPRTHQCHFNGKILNSFNFVAEVCWKLDADSNDLGGHRGRVE